VTVKAGLAVIDEMVRLVVQQQKLTYTGIPFLLTGPRFVEHLLIDRKKE
jgi:hypothetical protein